MNDNAPIVSLDRNDITVLETADIGSYLATAAATDADAPVRKIYFLIFYFQIYE